MHPALQHLGNIIREARSRLGLSQRQLAERAGLSSGMLCLIEKGEANPSVQSLLGLAEALEGSDCHGVEILSHCRAPTGHVRGCWVIDAILGNT